MSDDKTPSTLMCALAGLGGAAAVVGVMHLLAGKEKSAFGVLTREDWTRAREEGREEEYAKQAQAEVDAATAIVLEKLEAFNQNRNQTTHEAHQQALRDLGRARDLLPIRHSGMSRF